MLEDVEKKKMIRAELSLGMDSCMRALGVLRKTNVEALSFEMKDRLLTICVNADKERTAVLNLSKLADVRVL